jgi:hypothetical protein
MGQIRAEKAGPACRERLRHQLRTHGIGIPSTTPTNDREAAPLTLAYDYSHTAIGSGPGWIAGRKGPLPGTPSIRSPPESLRIITLMTGCGRYVPASSCKRTSGQWSFNHTRSSSVPTPSGPGGPSARDRTLLDERRGRTDPPPSCSPATRVASSTKRPCPLQRNAAPASVLGKTVRRRFSHGGDHHVKLRSGIRRCRRPPG